MKGINFKSQKVRLVAAAGLCLFTAVAVVTATVAWFTAFKKSDGSNEGMNIINPYGYFSSMTLHKLTVDGTGEVNGIDYRNNKFYFQQTPSASAILNTETGDIDYSPNFDVQMETYSDLDQHSPILMLITLNKTITATAEKPVTVYASCDKGYYFGEKGDNGLPAHDILETGNPLSSVVAFYSHPFTSLTPITGTGDHSGTYVTPIAQYEPSAGYDMESFVQFDEETGEPAAIPFIQNKNIVSISSGDVLYIAVIVDYYHYALEYVYNTFLGYDILEDTIYFTCDWNMVI